MNRIPVIEVLRGLAALAVAWFHLTNTYEWSWLRLSGSYGWLGVEVFFVLSGFVIPYALERSYERYSHADFPNFLVRRAVRLEPPYILSILVVIALWHLSTAIPGFRGGQPDYDILQLASHLCYLVPFTEYSWLQPVYWTLAYEFVFYFVIGLLFPFLFGQPGISRPIIVTIAIVALALSGILPPLSLLFLLGIAVFYHFEYAPLGGQGRFVVAIIVVLVLAAMIVLDNWMTVTAGLVAMLAIYAGKRLSFNHTIFRPLLGLGAISYSLYLVHVPIGGRVVNLGRRSVSGPWQELALSLLALAVSLGFAVLLWALVEKPSMRLARRLTTRLKPSRSSVGLSGATRAHSLPGVVSSFDKRFPQ